jgi:CDP-glucose 4,6-dehydratase
METLVNLQQLSSVYRGKKVFITGHTGFKGAWLTAILHTLGASIKGYALAPDYKNGLFSLLERRRLAESVIADIRDKARLNAEVNSFQPDYIFHLAAQPLVRKSYTIPAETFEVNAIGTANLLEALQQLQKKCTAIIITTDKVYENKEQAVLYSEDDRLGGYDPYSASKACTELVVSSFRNSFFNTAQYDQHHKAVFSARAGNVIGGGDWSEDRIIPDIVRALQAEEPVNVRNPSAVRPWQHVLEPLCAYLLLAGLAGKDPKRYSPAYNFGPLPQDHLTVKQLVDQAVAVWGSGGWQNFSDHKQPHEATLLQLDISLAEKELHWTPKWSAAEGIAQTLKWYQQPLNDQAAYTFQQINQYLAV